MRGGGGGGEENNGHQVQGRYDVRGQRSEWPCQAVLSWVTGALPDVLSVNSGWCDNMLNKVPTHRVLLLPPMIPKIEKIRKSI